jgi:hydrogenase expression/formation protein HypC
MIFTDHYPTVVRIPLYVVYYITMCLAVPALITKIDETMAEVDLGGVATRVSVLLTPEAKVGDYVVMHAGYALSVLDTEEAEQTLQLLREIAETDADE